MQSLNWSWLLDLELTNGTLFLFLRGTTLQWLSPNEFADRGQQAQWNRRGQVGLLRTWLSPARYQKQLWSQPVHEVCASAESRRRITNLLKRQGDIHVKDQLSSSFASPFFPAEGSWRIRFVCRKWEICTTCSTQGTPFTDEPTNTSPATLLNSCECFFCNLSAKSIHQKWTRPKKAQLPQQKIIAAGQGRLLNSVFYHTC